MRRFLALCVVLAGCAQGTSTLAPLSASLSDQDLTLVLTDGTTCSANWRAAPIGRLESCGAGFGYVVTEVKNPNILRKFWVEATNALGASGAVPPMAQVVITDASGHDHVFVSPVPFD